MLRFKTCAMSLVAIGASAAVAIGGLAIAGADDAGRAPTPPSLTVASTDGSYRDELWHTAREVVDREFKDDPIVSSSDDGKDKAYSLKADLVRVIVANFAKEAGDPYSEKDLVGPLYDDTGRLLGYGGPYLKRMISVEEYNSPTLNVCASQVAYLESIQDDIEAAIAELPVNSAYGSSAGRLRQTPAQRMNCR